MPVFEYKALDSKGRSIKGVVDADSVRSARQRLKGQGIFPTVLEEAQAKAARKSLFSGGETPKERKVDGGTLAIATRQLATLAAAGMPLVEALRALAEQIDHSSLKVVIAEVADKVNEGSTLAAGLREHPKVFPRLYANMVAAGEASGSLDRVLERLADLLESQTALRRKVRSALTYPILMLTLCFGVIVLLLTYIVPQITRIFADRGRVLPFPTRFVIEVSNFLQSYWIVLVILGALVVTGFKKYTKTPAGRYRYHALMLKVPMIGNFILKVSCSRFARNLGTLLGSGVELLGALTITKTIIGNVVLEEIVEKAADGVREGSSLALELDRSGAFPKLLVRMVAVGERTGQLEQMLLRAANNYDSEISAIVSSLTSILEPLLILFLATVVGGILAAVMLPMLEMSNLSAM